MKLEAAGVRLHVDVRGPRDGLPVVFLHGFPFHLGMWEPQLEALSDGYRAVAYDVRGLGRSEVGDGRYTMETFVDDLFAVMDGLETGPAVACGLSMGGYILLRAVEREPGRFRALVLCDTRSEADSNEGRLKRAESIRRIEAEGVGPFAETFPEVVLGPSTLERRPELVGAVREMIRAGGAAGICGAQLAMAARTDTTEVLGRVRVPTLLLFGEEDALTPPSVGEAMARRIPDSRLRIVPGAGHLSNLENPESFTRELLGFLDSLGAETPCGRPS